MAVLKMTSKRQVTFPVSVCHELNLKEGQSIRLEKHLVDGATAWLLRTTHSESDTWYGSLKKYAQGKSHDMEDIRHSIGRKITE